MPKTKTSRKSKTLRVRKTVLLGDPMPQRMFVASGDDTTPSDKLYIILECARDESFEYVPYKNYVGIIDRKKARGFPFWRFKLVHVV